MRTSASGFRNFEYGFYQIERPGKPFEDLNRAKLIYLKRFELLSGAGDGVEIYQIIRDSLNIFLTTEYFTINFTNKNKRWLLTRIPVI